MQGKIIGGFLFESKKTRQQWCNLFVQVQSPQNSIGICVEKLMCTPDRLPDSLANMYGHNYFISTNNNFASDFFKLPDTEDNH